ncbi:hypothetical protein BHE74_00021220 [Ensete ventricosum]|nr:hypothetical protein BHE74_00021220 [Ensete ventricosum]
MKLKVTGNRPAGGRKYFREVSGIGFLGQRFASREQETYRCVCEGKERMDTRGPVARGFPRSAPAEHHQPMRYGILQLYSVKAGWGRCYRKQAASSPLFYALLPSPTKLC